MLYPREFEELIYYLPYFKYCYNILSRAPVEAPLFNKNICCKWYYNIVNKRKTITSDIYVGQPAKAFAETAEYYVDNKLHNPYGYAYLSYNNTILIYRQCYIAGKLIKMHEDAVLDYQN